MQTRRGAIDGFGHKKTGGVKFQYPTLTTKQLCEYTVEGLCPGDLVHRDGVLLMWCTWPKLEDGLAVLNAWGFKYTTGPFVWVKQNPNGEGIYSGLGYHTNGNTEFILLGKNVTRVGGKLYEARPERLNKNVKQVILSPRREHSRKPDETYERIERLYPGPYLELFGRTRRVGWDTVGNDVDKFPILGPAEDRLSA